MRDAIGSSAVWVVPFVTHLLGEYVIEIARAIRAGSGRARSIDSSPFFRSARWTSMPSASTKVRWN